jgi:hypothetical protein
MRQLPHCVACHDRPPRGEPVSDLTEIRENAYAAYIRDAKNRDRIDVNLLAEASGAGLKAVWDASISSLPKYSMSPLSDIHMAAYAKHIRYNSGPGPTDYKLAQDANEAGLQAVWEAAAKAAAAGNTFVPPVKPTETIREALAVALNSVVTRIEGLLTPKRHRLFLNGYAQGVADSADVVRALADRVNS